MFFRRDLGFFCIYLAAVRQHAAAPGGGMTGRDRFIHTRNGAMTPQIA
jgi:hypothetical protein